MSTCIELPKDEIAAFCRRNRIRRLSVFGSVLRDDFAPTSDVDMLVEFEPNARVGLITLAAMEIELSRLLGRKADIQAERTGRTKTHSFQARGDHAPSTVLAPQSLCVFVLSSFCAMDVFQPPQHHAADAALPISI